MSKKDINKIDFDFLEASQLEKTRFREKEKINGICNISARCKQCIEDLLKDHNLFLAKREVFQALSGQEFIKNPGVALEYFFLEYLKDKVKLDKREPEKWESNELDLFYRHLGIQVTIELNPNKKENQLNKLRNKINSGENLFFTQEDEETGDIYKLVIPNREVPKNLGLLQFNSELIRGLINSGSTDRFLVNLKALNEDEFIKFYKDFEIIKKSFPFIIDRINYIENDRDNRLKTFSQNGEVSVYFDQEKFEKYQKELEEYEKKPRKEYKLVKTIIPGSNPPKTKYIKEYSDKPVFEVKLSNITYLYNKEKKEITFFVYREKFKGNELDELVYSFKYYFCNKKNVNNSFVEPELVYKNEEQITEEGDLSSQKILGKRKFIQSKIKIFTQKIEELKNKIKRIKINEEKIEKNFISKIVRELKKGSDYKNLKQDLEGINNDKSKKEELNTCISKLKLQNSEIIEIKKLKTWLEVFIKNLEKLLSGEDIDFSDLQSGVITDKELLLNDPVIQRHKFLDKGNELYSFLRKIKKLIKKSGFNNDIESKIISNGQRLLFVDKRKFNRGENNIEKIIEKIDFSIFMKKEEIKKFLEERNSELRNKKIKQNNKEIGFLENLKNKIIIFKNKTVNLRNEIKDINFNELLISDLKELNYIYSNKFLSNILISIIFQGEKIEIKDFKEEKLENKLNKLFSDKKSFNVSDFISFIKMFIGFGETIERQKIIGIEKGLLSGIKELKKKVDLLDYKINLEVDDISKEYKEFFQKSEKVSKILELIFSKEIIKNYRVSVNNFVALFLSNKKIDFDKAFLELVQKIGVENIKEFGEKAKLIEKFNENKTEIEGFNGFEIELEELKTIEDFRQVKIEIEQTFNDFEFKVGELSEIKEQLK